MLTLTIFGACDDSPTYTHCVFVLCAVCAQRYPWQQPDRHKLAFYLDIDCAVSIQEGTEGVGGAGSTSCTVVAVHFTLGKCTHTNG